MPASDSWKSIDPAILGDWPTRVRFWQNVKVSDGCWEWVGATFNRKDYGMFKPVRAMSPVGAHRFIFQVLHGVLNWRQQVCHSCDNPRCVRPDHLFLGTHTDNMADRNAKQRQAHGSRHGMAKLEESDVREIRRKLAAGQRQCDLALEYGVHKTLLSLIARRKNWAHVV